MSNDASYVETHKDKAVSYVGPDATNLFRAMTLRAAIQLYAKVKIIPTRGMTITRMLSIAKEYTGKTYKRGAYAEAISDLTKWIETMKTAIPVKEREG